MPQPMDCNDISGLQQHFPYKPQNLSYEVTRAHQSHNLFKLGFSNPARCLPTPEHKTPQSNHIPINPRFSEPRTSTTEGHKYLNHHAATVHIGCDERAQHPNAVPLNCVPKQKFNPTANVDLRMQDTAANQTWSHRDHQNVSDSQSVCGSGH